MKVAINNFVKRQIEGSGKTFSKTLSFEEIAKHAEMQLKKGDFVKGYREGVIKVNVDKMMIKHFHCPIVEINEESKLVSKIVKRRSAELPYIQTKVVNGLTQSPGKVQLILYSHKVLFENNENTTDSEWELISINSIPKGIEDLPMKPVTMMRNQLELPGGTKAFYSSDEWAKSIFFWQKYASIQT